MKRSEMNALVSATKKILTMGYREGAVTPVSREEFDVLSRLTLVKKEAKYTLSNGEEVLINRFPCFSAEFFTEERAGGKKYMINCLNELDLAAMVSDFQVFYKQIKLPQSRKKEAE